MFVLECRESNQSIKHLMFFLLGRGKSLGGNNVTHLFPLLDGSAVCTNLSLGELEGTLVQTDSHQLNNAPLIGGIARNFTDNIPDELCPLADSLFTRSTLNLGPAYKKHNRWWGKGRAMNQMAFIWEGFLKFLKNGIGIA